MFDYCKRLDEYIECLKDAVGVSRDRVYLDSKCLLSFVWPEEMRKVYKEKLEVVYDGKKR